MANTINKSKKPRSKRTTVRLRHKIEKASAAKQRKNRKLAKKDPTWKSKLKKDPGIPNNFPYKERLLHEIEQKKLLKQEQWARRKELAKGTTTGSEKDAEDSDQDASEEMSEVDADNTMEIDETVDEDANPMAALLASARAAAKDYDHELQSGDEMDDGNNDDEDGEDKTQTAPASRDTTRKAFDKLFKQVVDQADVVLYVLDARDPEGTRSREIERNVLAAASGGKRLILILNKVDLVPPPVLRGWLAHLRRYFPTIPLRAAGAASNARTFNHKDVSVQATSAALMRSLKSYAAVRNLKRAISVGVVGYPNVGKSSVINALRSRMGHRGGACPTGAEAGVTTGIRSVKIDSKLTLLDSPGIVFPSVSSPSGSGKLSKQDAKAHLVLLNAVPPKQIDDPVRAVTLLIKRLSTSPELIQNLLDVYDIPPLMTTNGDMTTDFLVQVARKRGRLSRGGVANLESAAMAVVTDWRDGRIPGWVEAPAQPAPRPNEPAIAGMKKIAAASGNGEDEDAAPDQTVVLEWAAEFKLDGLWGGVEEVADEDTMVS